MGAGTVAGKAGSVPWVAWLLSGGGLQLLVHASGLRDDPRDRQAEGALADATELLGASTTGLDH